MSLADTHHASIVYNYVKSITQKKILLYLNRTDQWDIAIELVQGNTTIEVQSKFISILYLLNIVMLLWMSTEPPSIRKGLLSEEIRQYLLRCKVFLKYIRG